jgi:hypothetical protein
MVIRLIIGNFFMASIVFFERQLASRETPFFTYRKWPIAAFTAAIATFFASADSSYRIPAKRGPCSYSSQLYSHSIVAGGFPLTSYTTRLNPRTSLMMRFETLPNRL